MTKLPVLEKFLSCNDVEVLIIQNTEFALKKINTKQAEYLNEFFEYFLDNPVEFVPFVMEIVVDKEKLKRFITTLKGYDENKLRALVYAICVQSLNLRPMSFDYTFSNEIKNVLSNFSIMNNFIKKLLLMGYKKSEIDEFSNNKIIRLTLEELFLRDRTECLLFILDMINVGSPELFPLLYQTIDLIRSSGEALRFANPNMKTEFKKEFESKLAGLGVKIDKPTVTLKTPEQLREEIKLKTKNKKSFNDLPK